MPTAIIHYSNPKAISLLKEMGNFMGFSIDANTDADKEQNNTVVESTGLINGIPYQKANPKADITKLLGIFDSSHYTKESLRNKAWKRRL